MTDWLKKRLTFIKKNEDRWYGLADSLEKVWEEYFDPEHTRLENLRSAYTMHHDDLNLKIRELGDYITSDLTKENNKPLAISWRHLELDYKDLEDILQYCFRRHFGNVKITWMPLFAPINKEYGYDFIHGSEEEAIAHPELKNIPPTGYFLTSRGMIFVDKDDLIKYGITRAQVLEIGYPLVKKFKPLHIVFDGFTMYEYFHLRFLPPTLTLTRKIDRDVEYNYTTNDRFDYVPADARPLDTASLIFTKKEERQYDIPFDHNYKFDETPADFIHLDHICFTATREKGVKGFTFSCEFSSSRNVTNSYQSYVFDRFDYVPADAKPLDSSGMSCSKSKSREYNLYFDPNYKFDEMPADFEHLDRASFTATRSKS